MNFLPLQFNYYTKRASLAAVYKATELHMIQDSSEDFQETWHFLDRRLSNLAEFGKIVRQVSFKDILVWRLKC